MSEFKVAVGKELLSKKGVQTTESFKLGDQDVVGIYFSAHWCPPCRGFTPVLVECYEQLKKKDKKFEVIFVSLDRNKGAFEEYYNNMPWLAVVYDEKEIKESLQAEFKVNGIPALVLVKGCGKVITTDGRTIVSGDPNGTSFPWN